MPMGMIEKRRYGRIYFKTPLHCKIRGETKGAYTVTEDLSPGGMGFIHERFIPARTHLMLEFNVLQKAVSSIARIAWTSSMGHTHTHRYGVEFLEIDQQSKNYLKDFFALKASA